MATVLCLCPTPADATVMRRLFASAGLNAHVFETPAPFVTALNGEVDVLLIAEDAIDGPAGPHINQRLTAQEDWSTMPLIVLSSASTWAQRAARLNPAMLRRVTLLERPVRLASLLGVVHMALAERAQQYRVRDLLAERAEGIARRDEFLAMLGHELRNPLGAISMCSEILTQNPEGAHAGKCIELIQNQAGDMKRLLDDLLDISRVTRGQLTLHPEPADLAGILGDAIGQTEHHLAEREQRLESSLPRGALPLHADPVRLRQAFVNLIHNASRYSPTGSTLTLRLEVQDRQAVVRIRDPGAGMTPETLAQIFQPFYRAETHTGKGLGVGLPLAQRLIQMHGGHLTASSAGPGLGSEFTVHLPLVPVPAVAAPSTRLPVPGDGREVLIIDDNRELAYGLRLLLEGQGYRVRVAHNGPDGLSAAEAQPPDIILLDIGMPGMDGFEVARSLRQRPHLVQVRLVAMSGYGDKQFRNRAQTFGIDAYLTKPFALPQLEQAMHPPLPDPGEVGGR